MGTIVAFRPLEHPSEWTSQVDAADALLQTALKAVAAGRSGEARALLRRAVVADLRRAEPWYWLGALHEQTQDIPRAAQAYYMALELGRSVPAREALLRLGLIRG